MLGEKTMNIGSKEHYEILDKFEKAYKHLCVEREEKALGFSAWLLRQTKRDDPIGDLASDAKQDKTFPKTNSKEKIANYLRSKRACHEAIEALTEAYAEFKLEDI